MKTFRYILSIVVLILGFWVGFLVGRSFVDWATASVEPSFYFMDESGTFFPLFVKFSFGLMGFLLATYLMVKIWPRNLDKRILHYIFIADVIFLVSLPLAIIGIFGLYWWDWSTGDRDFFIPIAPYCGCSLGLLVGLVIARFVLARKVSKLNGSTTKTV